ncbi:TetR/AcrR family transcriptional regulator [Methanothermobacter tenebrarum]
MKTTREKILEAARETFIKKGYKGATTRKIAQKAGVSEVTLFRNFKSKSSLLREILNENAILTSEIFKKLSESEFRDKPKEFLYKLAEEFFKLVVEKKIDLIFIILVEKELEEHGLEEWELLDSINKTLYSNLTNYFKEQIKKGNIRKISPETAALIFISYLSHLNLLSHFKECEIQEEKYIKNFINILLNGIKGGHQNAK